MTLSTLSGLILRFFALSWALKGVSSAVPLLFSMPWDTSIHTAMIAIFPVFYILAALLVWSFAPSFSRFMARGMPPEIALGPLTREDLFRFSFVLVGLWHALDHLPNALNWSHFFLRSVADQEASPALQDANIYEASQSMLGVILGLGCLLGSKRWSEFLSRNEKTEPSGPHTISQPAPDG